MISTILKFYAHLPYLAIDFLRARLTCDSPWHCLQGQGAQKRPPTPPIGKHLPMLEGCAHKALALLENEGGGVGHALQGLSHTSHYHTHEVASAMAQQVVNGGLAHGAQTWAESKTRREAAVQEKSRWLSEHPHPACSPWACLYALGSQEEAW